MFGRGGNFRGHVLLLWLLGAMAWTLRGSEGASRTRGIAYLHEELPEGPWSTYVLKISRTNRNFSFMTTLGNGASFGMSVVSDQVRTLEPGQGEAIAAVNGDFYDSEGIYFGAPRGLQVRDGELVSGPAAAYPCFWIDAKGAPHIQAVKSAFQVRWPDGKTTPFSLNTHRFGGGVVLFTAAVGNETLTSSGPELILERCGSEEWLPLRIGRSLKARVREVRRGGNSPVTTNTLVLSLGPRMGRSLPVPAAGAILELSSFTTPELKEIETAIGGGPELAREGKIMSWSGRQRRHPRTALGWNDKYYFLVEVDGRQMDAVGMTFPELGRYMIKLGCTDAMNLDGGGSSTFWIFGNVLNHPSEGRERPAPNALVVVQRKRTDADPAGPRNESSIDP